VPPLDCRLSSGGILARRHPLADVGLRGCRRLSAGSSFIRMVSACYALAVGRHEKVLQQVLSRASDANIRFDDLRVLLLALGFIERIRGSHHMFGRNGIEEKINLQSDGARAKPYQVKQVRSIILKYDLSES
jgi:hypothetical protein